MIDKRVLTVDYGGIKKGMLVVPRSRVGMGAIPTHQIWVGSQDSPGLVLEVFPHYNEATGAITPMAMVLLAGRRFQVSTRYIVPLPEPDETTEER